MTPEELERLGHALSKVIQNRYCWLVAHATRGVLLQLLDENRLPPLPSAYSFSLEDQRKGVPGIPFHWILQPLLPSPEPMAEAPDGTKFDHGYVREITLTALRGSFLGTVQSYLEYHNIADIIAAHASQHSEMFRFLCEARNLILHADGKMLKRGMRPCMWRDVTIESNGQYFKLSDAKLNLLIEDIIGVLVQLYIAGGKNIDYVSANLGYSVESVRACAEKLRAPNPAEQGPAPKPGGSG
jgi:hypothetical protein